MNTKAFDLLSDEKTQQKALRETEKIIKEFSDMYNFEVARWAFNKVLLNYREKSRLLKKKEELERKLAEINKIM